MPPIAKFKKNFNPSKPQVAFVSPISMNNEKLKESNFGAFVSLINEHDAKINKLIIVLTGNLHRHYIRLNKSLTTEQVDFLAQKMDSSWREINNAVLSRIHCEVVIIPWDPSQKQQVQTLLDEIRLLYIQDSEFNKRVDLHSKQYYGDKLFQQLREEIPGITLKDCQSAAIEYIFEECAGLEWLNSLGDYLTYPGEMNPCVEYIYRKYFAKLKDCIQYQEYLLKGMPLKIHITPDILPKELSKKVIRTHVLKSTKSFLNNAEEYKIKFFLRLFNELIIKVERDIEKNISHRRFSLEEYFFSEKIPSLNQNYDFIQSLVSSKNSIFFDYFRKEIKEKEVLNHVSNLTQKLLSKAEKTNIKYFFSRFDKLLTNMNEEKFICIRRVSF